MLIDMKKYKLILPVLALISSMLLSCEGFLDTKPTDSVVAETAMQTLYDANVAVNGIYVDMKYQDYYGTLMQLMGDQRGDNIQPRVMSTGWVQVYTLGYESESSTYFEIWNRCYQTIMRCNTLLANIENLEPANSAQVAQKNDYIGQAYAVRALVYFDLARLYGYPYMKDNGASLGAVLITGLTAPSESKQPRSTVAQTYEQVLDDLQTALPLLSRDKNTGHFNYWAARLLQARVFLYKGDWNNAYVAAKEVIDDSP
ncbi:MAG: RagB/SusD family nutrient uptake outer membrane protein, partial [Bacteroidia bacterium]|nr:RagB/SusD family nutrient uptake outer membrane protein [Bacteroidia bacterium]